MGPRRRDCLAVSEENYKFNVPEEIYGVIVDGIDLTILGSDSVRLIEAYVKQEGELSAIQKKFLKQCDAELKLIINKVDGSTKKYFENLHGGIKDVIRKMNKQ